MWDALSEVRRRDRGAVDRIDARFAEDERFRSIRREVEAYVAEIGRGASGGVWRGEGATVVAGFTREAHHHAAALRTRVDDPGAVRVVAVERTEEELAALAERIADELEELTALGVRPDSFGPDVEFNAVTMSAVVEDREAAVRLLAERYGDAVRLESSRTPEGLVRAVSWQLYDEPEPGALRVHYLALAAAAFERVEVDERPDVVRVTVLERSPGMIVPLKGATRSATVVLERPLGAREVVDGATGRARGRVPAP